MRSGDRNKFLVKNRLQPMSTDVSSVNAHGFGGGSLTVGQNTRVCHALRRYIVGGTQARSSRGISYSIWTGGVRSSCELGVSMVGDDVVASRAASMRASRSDGVPGCAGYAIRPQPEV